MDDKDLIIETMAKQNADLTALVQSLTETIKELEETIRELQRQLNQNSQNSSKPPSSDGFNKPKPQSQRQKSGKKQGGQKGHPGPICRSRMNRMNTANICRKSAFPARG